MRKKIFGAVLIAAMAVTAGWNYQQNKQSVELSELALANVEALARNEGSTTKCCPDPGDQCVLSSGDILGDQDEYPKDKVCP